MTILVEERLNLVKYVDNQIERKERLALELNSTNWDIPLPPNWDFELKVDEANAVIHISSESPHFFVEGIEFLYYVSERQVKCISKDELFTQALYRTIAKNIIVTAGQNGYNINSQSSKDQELKAAVAVLKHVSNEEQTIWIPYALGIKPNPVVQELVQDLDFSKLREYYEISEVNRDSILKALFESIQEAFHLEQQDLHVLKNNFYAFNWFIDTIRKHLSTTINHDNEEEIFWS